jgi:hypothetical protein
MPLDAVSLVRELARDGDDVEGMLVIGLDASGGVCGVGVNAHHRALSFVKVWEVEALARELDACSVVIALFPAGRWRAPTVHEIDAFVDLSARARRAQLTLHDCVIARGGQIWSLRELHGPVSGSCTEHPWGP